MLRKVPPAKNCLRAIFMMNFGGNQPILTILCQFQPNSPTFKDICQKSLDQEIFGTKIHPYGQHILVPSRCQVPPPNTVPKQDVSKDRRNKSITKSQGQCKRKAGPLHCCSRSAPAPVLRKRSLTIMATDLRLIPALHCAQVHFLYLTRLLRCSRVLLNSHMLKRQGARGSPWDV